MTDVDTHDWIAPLQTISKALGEQGLNNIAGILDSTVIYIRLCEQQQRADAMLIRRYQEEIKELRNETSPEENALLQAEL